LPSATAWLNGVPAANGSAATTCASSVAPTGAKPVTCSAPLITGCAPGAAVKVMGAVAVPECAGTTVSS